MERCKDINNPDIIINCQKCGKSIKIEECNTYFYHDPNTRGVEHIKSWLLCQDCYRQLVEHGTINKEQIDQEIQRTEIYLRQLYNQSRTFNYRTYTPKENEEFYFVDCDGDIREGMFDMSTDLDVGKYNVYNCFGSKYEAEQELEKLLIRRQLENIARTLNNNIFGFDPDRSYKYYLYMDDHRKTICLGSNVGVTTQGVVYCLDENFKDVAIEQIGEQRLKDYLLSYVTY